MIDGARETLLPHAVAAAAAVVMSEILLLALTRFGSGPGIITAVALPVALATLAIPGKKQVLLWLTVLALPILLFDVPPRRLGLTLGDILIAGLAVTTVLDKVLAEERSWRWEKTVFTWPLLGLLLAALVSAFLSDDSRLAFSDILENVRYLLFYVIFVNLVRTKEDLAFACWLLVAGCVPSLLLGFAQYYLGIQLTFFDAALPNTSFVAEGLDVIRIYGPFRESLTFAQYLAVPISFATAFLLYARKLAPAIALAGFVGLGCFALILTLSRGSWTTLAITLLVLIWLRVPKGLVPYLAIWPAIGAIAIAGYWDILQSVVPESVADRLSALGADYFIGRGYLWPAAFAIFADHPLFGVGLRNLYHVLPTYAPAIIYDPVWLANIDVVSPVAGLTGYTFHTHVDSVYITLLAEIGVVGIAPIAFLVFRALTQSLRNYRSASPDLKPYALGVLGALLALLLSMATIYGYSDIRLALLFWLLLAMTVVLQRLGDSGDRA